MLNCPPVANIVDLIYPVGSYFITESSDLDTVAKVQAHFGGTWVQVTGRFLYASTSAGATGGEETHQLTVKELPSHGHPLRNTGWYEDNIDNNTIPSVSCGYYGKNGTIWWNKATDVGGNQPHNNMPPYRTVYMFRRTA